MKVTKNISFSTQKGGAGKTTMTILTASFLHYTKGYQIAVIDCDYPQHGIVKMREREIEHIKNNPKLNKAARIQFTQLSIPAYKVIPSNVNEAWEDAQKLKAENPDLDFILFDTPGTVNQKGLLNLLVRIDAVFCPLSADRTVIESSLAFMLSLQMLQEKGLSHIKTLKAFWNICDMRESTQLYNVYEEIFHSLDLSLMQCRIPNLLRFHKEITDSNDIFRCTMFPPCQILLKNSRIEVFIHELLENIHHHE